MRSSSYINKAKSRISNRKWLKYSSNVARRISSAMEENELTQTALAQKLGLSVQYISRILSGSENLSLKTIAKFSDAVNTELISFPYYQDMANVMPTSSSFISSQSLIDKSKDVISKLSIEAVEDVKKDSAVIIDMPTKSTASVREQTA